MDVVTYSPDVSSLPDRKVVPPPSVTIQASA